MTSGLTRNEERILAEVARVAGEIAYPKKIAKALGLHISVVETALKKLLAMGFITDGDGGMN